VLICRASVTIPNSIRLWHVRDGVAVEANDPRRKLTSGLAGSSCAGRGVLVLGVIVLMVRVMRATEPDRITGQPDVVGKRCITMGAIHTVWIADCTIAQNRLPDGCCKELASMRVLASDFDRHGISRPAKPVACTKEISGRNPLPAWTSRNRKSTDTLDGNGYASFEQILIGD
jgi:hypothetical protein